MSRKTVEKNIAYDDATKKYYVNMDYGKDPKTKKRVKKTKTFESKRDAKKALREFEANKTKNLLALPTIYTVETWMNHWLEVIVSPKCRESTIYGYRNIIDNHISPYFGDTKLQELSVEDIDEYFLYLKETKNLSTNTRRKHYDLLKSALKSAQKKREISYNPIDDAEKPDKVINEQNVYTIDQLKKLFEIVENHRMEVCVKLAGYCGLRREEIDALKWRNVYLQDKYMVIAEGRTQAGSKIVEGLPKSDNSVRKIAIPDDLATALTKEKSKQERNKEFFGDAYNDGDFVVAWDDGRPYRPNYLSGLFKKLLADNNLPHLRLHDLRHTFASVANLLGVSIYEISKILGHSNVLITDKQYTHLFDVTHRQNINLVAENINKDNNKKRQ